MPPYSAICTPRSVDVTKVTTWGELRRAITVPERRQDLNAAELCLHLFKSPLLSALHTVIFITCFPLTRHASRLPLFVHRGPQYQLCRCTELYSSERLQAFMSNIYAQALRTSILLPRPMRGPRLCTCRSNLSSMRNITRALRQVLTFRASVIDVLSIFAATPNGVSSGTVYRCTSFGKSIQGEMEACLGRFVRSFGGSGRGRCVRVVQFSDTSVISGLPVMAIRLCRSTIERRAHLYSPSAATLSSSMSPCAT